MSWRALIIFLLLAVAASWQGGRQLGLWLVEQAPESIASASNQKDDRGEVLDANGKPLAPQPPQPRIDGTLGVPKEMGPVEWEIAPVIASRADANSYKKDGEDDEEENPEQQDNDSNNSDPGTVPTIDVQSTSGTSAPRPATPPPAPPISWQASLKKELTQCRNVGFFRRPGCIDSALTKYCGPNNAWGKTADCPDRNNTLTSGG